MEMNLSGKPDTCLLRALWSPVFHITKGNSQKQVDEEDGVKRHGLRGFVFEWDSSGRLSGAYEGKQKY